MKFYSLRLYQRPATTMRARWGAASNPQFCPHCKTLQDQAGTLCTRCKQPLVAFGADAEHPHGTQEVYSVVPLRHAVSSADGRQLQAPAERRQQRLFSEAKGAAPSIQPSIGKLGMMLALMIALFAAVVLLRSNRSPETAPAEASLVAPDPGADARLPVTGPPDDSETVGSAVPRPALLPVDAASSPVRAASPHPLKETATSPSAATSTPTAGATPGAATALARTNGVGTVQGSPSGPPQGLTPSLTPASTPGSAQSAIAGTGAGTARAAAEPRPLVPDADDGAPPTPIAVAPDPEGATRSRPRGRRRAAGSGGARQAGEASERASAAVVSGDSQLQAQPPSQQLQQRSPAQSSESCTQAARTLGLCSASKN